MLNKETLYRNALTGEPQAELVRGIACLLQMMARTKMNSVDNSKMLSIR